MNTLLFHIGIPKTGTTSIQRFLYENAEFLAKNHWEYPELTYLNKNEIDVLDFINGMCFLDDDVEYLWNEQDGFTGEQWDRLWQSIKKSLVNNNVLISNERLVREGVIPFFEAAKREYNNIKIVIYLRRQDYYVESCYNQWFKDEKDNLNFYEFIQGDGDYLGLLLELEKIVGRENLIVRVFEREQLIENDVLVDFMDILGIRDLSGSNSIIKENIALNDNLFEIKKWINRYVKDSEYVIYRDAVYRAIISDNDKKIHPKGVFSSDERKRYLQTFEEDNQFIARHFLGREDGKLFWDTRMDIPTYQIDYAKMYEDIFRILVDASALKTLADSLKSFCVWYSLGDYKKPLCLFGAGRFTQSLLKEYQISVKYIIDNDKAKEGKNIEGVPIIYTRNVKDWKECFIVISSVYGEEMAKQLQEKGLKRGKDFMQF